MFVLSRFRSVSNWVVSVTRPPTLPLLPEEASLFPELDVDAVVAELRQVGCSAQLRLPADILGEMLSFATTEEPLPVKPKWLVRPAVRAFYPTFGEECGAARRLASDAKIHNIAARYLESEPMLKSARLGWCFVGDRKTYRELAPAQTIFHYDLADYRVLKFFFYLTDVDANSGPHVCIRSSHTRKHWKHQFALFAKQSDREIYEAYGRENWWEIVGPAGFGFVEDVYCFHRGTPPVNCPRLMVKLTFTRHQY